MQKNEAIQKFTSNLLRDETIPKPLLNKIDTYNRNKDIENEFNLLKQRGIKIKDIIGAMAEKYCISKKTIEKIIYD